MDIQQLTARLGDLNDPQFVGYVRKQQETTPELSTLTAWMTAVRQEIDLRLLLAYTKLSNGS